MQIYKKFFLCIFIIFVNYNIQATKIKVFSGFDVRHPVGTYVFFHSIKKNASQPVELQILDEEIYVKE